MAVPAEYTKVLSQFQDQCSRREYCSADVYRKALKALGEPSLAEQAVEALVAERYVDDLRYSSAFARDKAHLAGWGPVKISYALAGKGIARDIIREALEEIEGERADARLEALLRAKAKTLKGDPQSKHKLVRFALGRGYTYESVSAALKGIL